MSLLNGGLSNGLAGSSISAEGGGRRVVRVRSVSHAGSPPSSPGSSSATSSSSSSSSSLSSSSSPTLALEDLPLVLSILLEVDARQANAAAPSPTSAQEGQAWVAKIREALDDALEEDDESAGDAVEKLGSVLECELLGPDRKWSSCLDMVLKLEQRSALPVINHLLVASAVEHLWSRGRSSGIADDAEPTDLEGLSSTSSSSLLSRRYALYLDSLCTPSRLHALAFGSRLLHLALTLAVLLYPGGLIVENDSAARTGASWREILWNVWTIGVVVDTSTRGFSLSLLLPALVLIVLAFFPTFAYPLLTLALPGLLFGPMSPRAPSVAHLNRFRNAWLPLAAYASLLLKRLLKPLALLLPALLVIFGLVTLAFDGDPWRLGFAFAPPSPEPGPVPTPGVPPGTGPREPGVAPFGVRLWLAISFTLLLALGLLLGCSRIAPASVRSRSTGSGDEDKWAAEWGPEAADLARLERVRAVRDFLPSPSVPPSSDGRRASADPAAYRRPSTGGSSLHESQPLVSEQDPTLVPYRATVLPSPVNLIPALAAPALQLSVYALHRELPADVRARKVDRLRAALDRWLWRSLAFILRLDAWEWVGRKSDEATAWLRSRTSPQPVRLE